ncbi:PEP-CTERM sorting domain-containing protein [Roseateles sp. LYH14W]|uniref:PEP-CTERM sorting domain-containing protein n=1 Tax=Pelomonas parva TaxID=3299032 RepID=A0ABW7F449_9BURK
MILPQSSLSRLTLAALATLLGQVGVANAAPVVGASSMAAVASGPASPATYATGDGSYVSSQSSISDPTGSSYGYAFANVGGAYAVNSNSAGVGNSAAHAQFAHRFTNTTGVAQHYTLSFYIYGGNISANANYRPLDSGESLTSRYSASVKTNLNGTTGWNSVFSSAAIVTTDDTGSTGSRSGVDLFGSDDNFSDGNYAWSGAYYSVNLGIVAAGDFVDVLSEVDNSAMANVGTYTFTGGDCGYGDGVGYGDARSMNCGYGEVFAGSASSFYGDPLELNGEPQAFALTAVDARDLPEPASLALVGLAVGAAGLARRKRKQGDGE